MVEDFGSRANSTGLFSDGSNSSNGTDANGNATGTNENDEPVENKHNDLTKFWDVETGEMYMNSDTPNVKIYISREKPVVDEDEKGEEGEKQETLEEAMEEDAQLAVILGNNPDITNNNTTIVKFNNGDKAAAKNALDKLDLSDVDNIKVIDNK